MQHAADKERFFNGVVTKQAIVDLIIVDVPKGLPGPTVSNPPASNSKWNHFSPKELGASHLSFCKEFSTRRWWSSCNLSIQL